jgi:hypothetical protein
MVHGKIMQEKIIRTSIAVFRGWDGMNKDELWKQLDKFGSDIRECAKSISQNKDRKSRLRAREIMNSLDELEELLNDFVDDNFTVETNKASSSDSEGGSKE